MSQMPNTICVCVSYFGDPSKIDIPENIPKIDDFDYFLFTNVRAADIRVQHPYTVFTIDTEKDTNVNYLPTNVHRSRFFKFQLHKAIRQYVGRKYDFVMYVDHYMYLKPDKDWKHIQQQAENHHSLKIVQKKHKGVSNTNQEMDYIVQLEKETRANIDSAKLYLRNLKTNYDLSKPITYVENNIFGFCPQHAKTCEHYDLFWMHYLQSAYKTYRDQPLWNVLYDAISKSCAILDLESYCQGKIQREFSRDRYVSSN
jgi:hypothetical protein